MNPAKTVASDWFMKVPLLTVLAGLSLISGASAQIVQQAYLKASDTGPDGRFGFSVAIDEDILVVGACNAEAAYVFERDAGGIWAQKALLKASNAPAGFFGYSVAVSADTIVVSSPWENRASTGVNGDQNFGYAYHSGAAYVFVRDGGGNWNQQAYLKASNTDADDEFGSSVAISGDTIVVGARGEDSDATGVDGDQENDDGPLSGAAYVFTRNAGAWIQEAYLKASNTGSGDRFGGAVAISGNTLVVGADREDSGASGVDGDQFDDTVNWAGAAYVFSRAGGGWSQEAYLKPGATDPDDGFGSSVAITGDTLVVGAPRDDSAATGGDGDPDNYDATNSGAAWVFVRDGGAWSPQAYLKASNTDAHDEFGSSVTISGETIIGGAIYEDSAAYGVDGDQSDNNIEFSGAAYLYTRSGTQWNQQAYLKASNTGSQDLFGWSVSASSDTVVVGAQLEDSAATGVNGDESDTSASGAGAAYVFGVRSTSRSPLSGFTRLQKPKPFPSTRIGRQSRPQTLGLTNAGSASLTGLRAATAGRARRDFRVTQPTARTLPPGASTSLKVTFRPRSSGIRRAELKVLSNSAPVSSLLFGRGKR